MFPLRAELSKGFFRDVDLFGLRRLKRSAVITAAYQARFLKARSMPATLTHENFAYRSEELETLALNAIGAAWSVGGHVSTSV